MSLSTKIRVLLSALVVGCTAIGIDSRFQTSLDFGSNEVLRICVLVDEPSVSREDAAELLNEVRDELQNYNIDVIVPWYKSWVRSGFNSDEIILRLASLELSYPCDRIMVFVGRNFGDFVVGLIGIEALGAVDTVTHTRGYVVARVGSFNQILEPPSEVVRHESYHMLGCRHSLSMSDCYKSISKMKSAAKKNRESGIDFFPGVTSHGKIIAKRSEVNQLEGDALRSYFRLNSDLSSPKQ